MTKNANAKQDEVSASPFDLVTFGTGKNGALKVKQRGADALEKIFGSESPAVNEGLLLQCFVGLSKVELLDGGEDRRDFMPAIVRDIAPRDAIERLLAVQMATTHVALIRQGKRMANADQLPQFEANERAYNKLARTFAAQVEALRKHRNGGKQTVVVQHVNVADGAQAVIGNVQTRGRGKDEGSIRISYALPDGIEQKVNLGGAHGPSRLSGLAV